MGGLTVGQGAAHSQVHKVIYNIEFIIIKKIATCIFVKFKMRNWWVDYDTT